MTTLVTVGNTPRPFPRLLRLVTDSLAELPKPVVVQHGPAPFSDPGCLCVEKLPAPEYRRWLEEASLVICHAGQGAMLEAAALRKPIIAVPRLAHLGEHIDDHQIQLAEFFAEHGWVVLPKLGESLAAAAARAAVPSGAPLPDFTGLTDTVMGLIDAEARRRGVKV